MGLAGSASKKTDVFISTYNYLSLVEARTTVTMVLSALRTAVAVMMMVGAITLLLHSCSIRRFPLIRVPALLVLRGAGG